MDHSNQQDKYDDDHDSSVFMDDESQSSDNISYDDASDEGRSLLQPHGISTGETKTKSLNHKRRSRSTRAPSRERDYKSHEKKNRRSRKVKPEKKGRFKKNSFHSQNYRRNKYYLENDDYTDSSSDNDEYRIRDNRRSKRRFDKESEKMLRALRAEVKELRKREEERNWMNRLSKWTKSKKGQVSSTIGSFFSDCVNFISNLPLTIGAIALALVTLGIVWFKFAEEMMESCQPVHFHSSRCHYGEFPGCFDCDTSRRMFKVALNFHLACSGLAGFIAILFFAKIFIARDIVFDEMNSPTTASPAGLMCMTLVCVFAGKGFIGEIIVTFAATLHFFIAVWFIHMAVAYNILPDPSWYPNTVGIGISAEKLWLYHPLPGHLLMAVSIILL